MIEKREVIISAQRLHNSQPSVHLIVGEASDCPGGEDSVFDSVEAKMQCTEAPRTTFVGRSTCLGPGNLDAYHPRTLIQHFPPSIKYSLLDKGGYKHTFA